MLGLVGAFVLVTLNWLAGAPSFHGPGFVRIGTPAVGAVFVAAAQFAPAAALLAGIRGFRGGRRLAVIALVAPFVVVSLPLALVATVDAAGVLGNGYSSAVKPLDTAHIGNGIARVYQTNGGATTGYGVLLRFERTVVPGVQWSRNVRTWYPAESARLRIVDRSTVTVEGLDAPATFTFGS